MNCKQAEILLSRSLDGELDSPEQQKLLKEHLESCATCRKIENSWTTYGQYMRELEVPSPQSAVEAWQDIRNEIQGAEESPELPKTSGNPGFNWNWGIPTAIAALLVLSTALYFGLPTSNDSTESLAAGTKTKIEFLETDIPGASTMVYVDQDSGLTVLWVVESVEG